MKQEEKEGPGGGLQGRGTDPPYHCLTSIRGQGFLSRKMETLMEEATKASPRQRSACECMCTDACTCVLVGNPQKGSVYSPSILWDTQERPQPRPLIPIQAEPREAAQRRNEQVGGGGGGRGDVGCLGPGHDANAV